MREFRLVLEERKFEGDENLDEWNIKKKEIEVGLGSRKDALISITYEIKNERLSFFRKAITCHMDTKS